MFIDPASLQRYEENKYKKSTYQRKRGREHNTTIPFNYYYENADFWVVNTITNSTSSLNPLVNFEIMRRKNNLHYHTVRKKMTLNKNSKILVLIFKIFFSDKRIHFTPPCIRYLDSYRFFQSLQKL